MPISPSCGEFDAAISFRACVVPWYLSSIVSAYVPTWVVLGWIATANAMRCCYLLAGIGVKPHVDHWLSHFVSFVTL